MRGISEENLIACREDKLVNETAVKIIDALLGCCKELNEWKPIGENTPKDRKIMVYNKVTGAYITRFSDGEYPFFGWTELNGIGAIDEDVLGATIHYPHPTHWQELPEPPKD